MKEEKKIGTPLGACYFILSVQVLLSWAIYQGIFTADVYLLYGLFSLVAFIIYIGGGVIMLMRNEDYFGGLFILFGALFGGMYGLAYIAYFFAGIFGWALDATILGIPMFLSGIVIIPSLLEFRYGGWFEFTIWILMVIWLITGGIEYFVGGQILFTVNKYLALISGLGVTYFTISEFMIEVGLKPLPMGKPLFKYPEQ